MHSVSEASNVHAQNTLPLNKSHGWMVMHKSQVLEQTINSSSRVKQGKTSCSAGGLNG